MIFRFFIVINLFIKIVFSSNLTVFRANPYISNYLWNYSNQMHRLLLCINDSPKDAVIWNTNLKWITKDLMYSAQNNYKAPKLPKNPSHIDQQCRIDVDSLKCFSEWGQHGANWTITNSFDIPMGPVYDYRWENFPDFNQSNTFESVKIYQNGKYATATFEKTGALTFSIRGPENAHILLCESEEFSNDFCYWLIIGGWANSESIVRKCESGVPDGFPVAGSSCSVSRARVVKRLLSINEWKTFILTWEEKSRTLKLYDPDKMILSYSDRSYNFFSNSKSYYIFYRNPSTQLLFRFHSYSYTLATQPKATLRSQPLIIGKSQEICIDMLVGLCKQCELVVSIVDGSGKRRMTKRITRSNVYKEIEHDLPMWQRETIKSNVSDYYSPITLEIVTDLLPEDFEEVGNHWAITQFDECLPEGSVKIIKMVANQDYSYRTDYFWPSVTCQKLSYDYPSSEIVDSTYVISTPPNDLEYCPSYKIGPYCSTNCITHFQYCQFLSVCKNNSCYCAQGYKIDNYQECTSSCNSGSYGYGCTKKCNNCERNICNSYDGKCFYGCNIFHDKFLIPPYCNDVIKKPPPPTFDLIKETSARAAIYQDENYGKINATFGFEIKAISDNDFIYNVTNYIEEYIYYSNFTNLMPGMEYSVKAIINIQHAVNKYQKIEGESATFETLCNWSEKFEIIPEERSLLINRIFEEKLYPCPDSWYMVQTSTILSNDSQSDATNKIVQTFPITISGLTPYTQYNVSVNNKDNKHHIYNLVVSTLEAAPTQVVNLNITSIRNTEAEIVWESPTTLHGTLAGYDLTIKVLYYRGCKTKKNTPENLLSTIFRSNIAPNKSVSYKIEDLIPYVSYEVTVVAFNSKKGNESKINFNTTELKIPTETMSYLNFSKGRISWENPDSCWKISGPIAGARVILFGVSDYVKNFYDIYDTIWHTFDLNRTKPQEIYGNEKYKTRIHVLRKLDGDYNKTAFSELLFTTDPSPPPKVRKLEIIEIDEWNTTLRWQEPSSPTNGEIIYYTIRFLGLNQAPKSEIRVYPNEQCSLWKNLLCRTVAHPRVRQQYIEVKAYNKGVNDPGAATKIIDTRTEPVPEEPKISFIKEEEKGTVYLKWQHPYITGGPLKKFFIHRKIIFTELEQSPSLEDEDDFELPIYHYEVEYDTHLQLLPSTRYNISVQGITEKQSGKLSSIEIETNSSLAFEYEPHPVLDNKTSVINIFVPPVIYNTKDSMLHIIIKGPSNCEQEKTLSQKLKDSINLQDGEIAWCAKSILTHKQENKTFIIGSKNNNDNISKCALNIGSAYMVYIVIHEKESVNKLKQAQTFVWESEPIQVGPVPNKHHESWAIPLVLLLGLIGGISYYYLKKRNNEYFHDKKVDEMSEPIPIHPIALEKKNKKLNENENLDTFNNDDFRESILLTDSYSKQQPNRVVTESIYENLRCNSLIKINQLQDYVKQAITSGKLDQQYELFPRGQIKPWQYGSLIQNKSKNRYGNLIAYDDTRVILEKLPDDPYSDYINANYISGYNSKKAYIATQGPKPNTLVDFWRMIWQENVQVICMLANTIEGGKKKCEQYWPEIGKEMKFGKITVANINHAVFADYSFRTFNITLDHKSRKVQQLHFTAWPDHGVPSYTQSVVSYLKKLLATPAGNGPILVHCSAGVGRTGTIIVCDICLRRAAAEGFIDVFGETQMIRNERASMIDNKQQYLLAHLALVECLLALPTSIPCNDNLLSKIQEFKGQLVLQQQALEESAWQDRSLQPVIASLKLSKTNLAKNRFPDLAPVAQRLYITRYPTSDDDSNYITGVYVDSARRKDNYIASQLPLPNTVGDFWRMVAEFNVELIILLQPIDPNDKACGKFIPNPDEEMKPVPFLNLKGKAIEDSEISYQQKIILTNTTEKSVKERCITILTCKEWKPGKNEPPPKPAILVDLWQTAERISRSEEPTLVLCYDGVTNCGLYLALSFLLERMGLERECDVCLAIRAIRRSRPDFCKSIDQFSYLYDTAAVYSEYFETYANFM